MNKMGLNRFDYKTDYIKFLAVALSSDAVVMDQGLKEMFEKQIIDMFREPDMYADLFMFKKFILGNPDIDDKVKKDLLESIWGSDEEYDDMISKLEWQVIGTIPASEGFVIPSDKVSMYDYSLQDLEKMYHNPASARIIHEEIELCRELKKFKPENKGAVLEKKVN